MAGGVTHGSSREGKVLAAEPPRRVRAAKNSKAAPPASPLVFNARAIAPASQAR